MCRLKDAREDQLAEQAERRAKQEHLGKGGEEEEEGYYEEDGEEEDDEADGEEDGSGSIGRGWPMPAVVVKRKRMSADDLDAVVTLFGHFGPGGAGTQPKENQRDEYFPPRHLRSNHGDEEREFYGGKRFGRGGGRGGNVGGGLRGGKLSGSRKTFQPDRNRDGFQYEDTAAAMGRDPGFGDQRGRAADTAENKGNSDFLTELKNLMK
jgi:hypothetical protein